MVRWWVAGGLGATTATGRRGSFIRREGTRARFSLLCERDDGDRRWARARERGGSFAVATYS
jgi:hypothetical protein